jgi:AraC family transcriptional regulator
MHVELRLLPPMHLAYMRCTGPYTGPYDSTGSTASIQTWGRFAAWCHQHGLDNPDRMLLGIQQDRPSTTPAELCRYDCCVQVDEGFMPSAEVAVQDFAGGRYVCGQFSSTAADIQTARMHLRNEWLPSATADGAWRLMEAPLLEIYPQGYRVNAETGVLQCSLCLPIRAA